MRLVKSSLIALLLFCLGSYSTFAGPRDQARRLYSSLTGATPTNSEVSHIANLISQGRHMEATLDIIDSRNGINSKGAFYNITVKNFATPISNVDRTKMAALNDLSATVIGYVRDDRPFNEILYSDSIYMANGIKMANSTKSSSTTRSEPMIYHNDYTNTCSGVPACTFCKGNDIPLGQRGGRIIFEDPATPMSGQKLCTFTRMTNSQFWDWKGQDRYYIPHLDVTLSTDLVKHTNAHYQDMEDLGLDLSDPRLLVHKSQMVRLHQDQTAIAGMMSLRAWGNAYYTAGTNRRGFAAAMSHFFCKEMMDLNDTNIPDYRVRRDVDRSPGGDSTVYLALCKGCHGLMDSHAGAFAYYDFPDGAIVYNQGVVVSKMNHNAIFPEGFITQDNGWINLMNEGQNADMGWGPLTGGQGAQSLGMLYASTKQLYKCTAEKVWETVCYKKAESAVAKDAVSKLAAYYEENGYNLKNLFRQTAIACMGQ